MIIILKKNQMSRPPVNYKIGNVNLIIIYYSIPKKKKEKAKKFYCFRYQI